MRPQTGLLLLAVPFLAGGCGLGAPSSGPEAAPLAVEAPPGPALSSLPAEVRVTLATRRLVELGADGFFVLNGKRTVMYGVEEEHHRYTRPELDLLVPRLKQLGVNFVVLYPSSRQEDFFYERLEVEGLWVAQELGNTKKRVASPFANTGGVLGTVPDAATIAANLANIDAEVGRLGRFKNILFWWMGGEYAEPDFKTPAAALAVRDSIALYADAVRAKDPYRRPFTVSHHYVEALEEVATPFIDFSDLTDFTWFTVATHFHLGDFVPGAGWSPVAQASEVPAVFEPLLARAFELNHRRPLFFGGFFAQAPLLGPCAADRQEAGLREKWRMLSTVPSVGASSYHLAAWNGNGIPHALFERHGGDWVPTAAGDALRALLATAPR